MLFSLLLGKFLSFILSSLLGSYNTGLLILQGWKERPVFGKIRYMNYNGCKRKFNVDGYIMNVSQMVAKTRKKLQEGIASTSPSKPAGRKV